MGFCKSGDVLDLIEGRRTDRPRELCGLCVELWRWTKEGKLRRKKPEPWLVKRHTKAVIELPRDAAGNNGRIVDN